MVLFTLSLMIGTAGLPHVIMRFFTVPKVSDARWSAGWALVFIALLYLTAPAVGAMARLNITEMMWPNGTTAKRSVEQIENDDPLRLDGHLAEDRSSGWEDKNGDGKIQYYNDKNAEAAGQGGGKRAGKATS
jgi:cation/acetate symporter